MAVHVKKALRDFLCVLVRFLAEVWFVLLGWSEPAVVVRYSRPEHCLPASGDRADNAARNVPNCVYVSSPGFWQIFGKWLLSEGTASGKSENDRINTGDFWWAWVDLNHRPRPYQGRALAT